MNKFEQRETEAGVVFRIRRLFFQVVDCRRMIDSSTSFSKTHTQHIVPQIRLRAPSRMTTAYLNRIATAVPEHDVHDAFAIFAEKMLVDPRLRAVFRRMVSRADIAHRYSFLDPYVDPGQFSSHDAHKFYRLGNFPNTARRMELFEQSAPVLMRKAVDRACTQ